MPVRLCNVVGLTAGKHRHRDGHLPPWAHARLRYGQLAMGHLLRHGVPNLIFDMMGGKVVVGLKPQKTAKIDPF